jgi:hypothetical protein
MSTVSPAIKRAGLFGALVVLAAGVLVPVLSASPALAAGLAIDASIATHEATPAASITSGSISTKNPNDLLVAFVTSDGPNAANGISLATVTGGGLTWSLRQRTNAQPGTAEIWSAVASSVLTNIAVTATRSSGSYVGSIVVVAFSGASSVTGATATGNGTTGPPTANLKTTQAGSWVWAVGTDWDNAVTPVVGNGQTLFDQYQPSVGDTYWVQSQASPGGASGSTVTINDTVPATDHWDLSLIEIAAAVPDTQPPTAPTKLAATAVNSNQVALTWTASTDNVGVAGYQIFRTPPGGLPIATTGPTPTSYTDSKVAASTSYTYTVQAFDAAGNVSQPSNSVTVQTPPPAVNPPLITNVGAGSITQTSATVTWTTDVPSSSQVLYGTTTNYGSQTTLDSTPVTSHTQTLTGLAPGTPYHYEVVSTGSTSNTAASGDNTFTTAPAVNVTLPDLQIKVPTNLMSIGTVNGQRQLQFTHITWDAGAGPFEIDPTYNSATGTSSFVQAIYRSPSPGVWTYDHSVPVAATGVWNPPSDYQFPLTRFTLNTVNPDGSLGAVVATSPKVDYCMTADTYVGGVSNTPNCSYIPQDNCATPTLPLGWSVGWGDQYDQTDSGQPISLTGIADGTYILHATVDPNHVLTESNTANNVTDTVLQISGNTVTVVSQTNPGTTPPSVAVTSPASGASVSGTVTLTASASAAAPAMITSVQFLLDGANLGSPVTTAPYSYSWTVGSTALGSHNLSARATDSSGNVATAPTVPITVVSGGGSGCGTTPPTVAITNPTLNETVSGPAQPVAATATAMGGATIASVQFLLDGANLGSPVTTAPYAVTWNTTTASAGTHTVSSRAMDSCGNLGMATAVSVTVQNPGPPMTCFVLQTQQSTHGSGNLTTPAFHTAVAGEVLVAFVSADGPSGAGTQTVKVSGAGLTWTLVKRANAQSGDAEAWTAKAPSVLSSAIVTSTEAHGGYSQDLTVIAMEGVGGVGASVAGSGATGAPALTLTTTASTSLVFAVGDDWDNALGRTLPGGWVFLDQWVNTRAGDTYWTQYTNTPTGAAGSVVPVGDLGPTSDRWNLVAIELTNSG